MYEHLRNAFINKLSLNYGREDINKITAILDGIAKDYEITDKCTELMILENFIPEEVKTYLVSKAIEGCSEATVKNYKTILEMFFQEIQKPVQKIETNDIRLYLVTYKQRRGIKDRTLEKYRQILYAFFAWLTDEEYITKNPCKTIRPIKYEIEPRHALTRQQLEELRRMCKDDRDLALVDVLFSTACRISELANMRFSDISQDGRTIHIIGKGSKHNDVYINDNAFLSLRAYLETRKGDNDYIFTSIRSPYNKLSTRNIEHIFKGYEKKLGCRLTPHIIRHTTATLALQSGMEITEVQKMLNHSSVATTQIYAETSMDDVRASHRKYVV